MGLRSKRFPPEPLLRIGAIVGRFRTIDTMTSPETMPGSIHPIVLSIGLIGTPEEYDRFPDHGTLIMGAINRGVQLFQTFDFLSAAGNLIVIFSDGQDTHAVYEGTSLDDILQEASDAEIPVYFIRTSYDRELGDILPDITWKLAVERTGGKFFPAANDSGMK